MATKGQQCTTVDNLLCICGLVAVGIDTCTHGYSMSVAGSDHYFTSGHRGRGLIKHQWRFISTGPAKAHGVGAEQGFFSTSGNHSRFVGGKSHSH